VCTAQVAQRFSTFARTRILYILYKGKAFSNIYPVVFWRHARRGATQSKVLHGLYCSSAIFSAAAHCLPIASSFITHWFYNTRKTTSLPFRPVFSTLEQRRDLPARTQTRSDRRYCSIFQLSRERERERLDISRNISRYFIKFQRFFPMILVISMTKIIFN